MKKIADIDLLLPTIGEGDKTRMPSRREILRLIGNVKTDTAEDARRTVRILNALRDVHVFDLVLANDDMAFLLKVIEKNTINLAAWVQGQILALVESAEDVPEEPIV